MPSIDDLRKIGEVEFADIVKDSIPYHFHNGSQQNVEASPFPLAIVDGFRAFLEFVRTKLESIGQNI